MFEQSLIEKYHYNPFYTWTGFFRFFWEPKISTGCRKINFKHGTHWIMFISWFVERYELSNVANMVWKWLIGVKTPYFEGLYLNKKWGVPCLKLTPLQPVEILGFEKEGIIIVLLNQILLKYYEDLGICYILYDLEIHSASASKPRCPVPFCS